MQKNEKLIQFHQALQGSSFHDFNLQLGDDFQPPQHQPAPKVVAKSRSGVESFLESIDSSTFDLMKKYLRENKDFLDKPIPPKIALYEDIKIIYEFKRGEAEILLNKGKAREAISEKLALGLRRSKATILDRMKKKLYKLTSEDIEHAINTNTPFNFDKKDQRSKSTVPSVINSRVDLSENKKVKSEEDELEKLGVGLAKDQVRHEPKREIYGLADLINDWDRHVASVTKKRIYKYGKQDLKQRIFIYANKNKKQIVVLSQSQAADFREDFLEKQKKEIEKIRISTPEKPKIEDQEWKSKEEAPIPKMQESQEVKIEDSEKYEKIEVKEQQTQQEEANISQQEKEEAGVFSFLHKPMNPPIPESPKGEVNYQQQHKKMLYQLNNNERTLQLLSKNPQLKQELVWSEEEDGLLYQYSFNTESGKLGIICLLRYKPIDYILQRLNFLSLELDSSALTQLKTLAGKVDEPMDIV